MLERPLFHSYLFTASFVLSAATSPTFAAESGAVTVLQVVDGMADVERVAIRNEASRALRFNDYISNPQPTWSDLRGGVLGAFETPFYGFVSPTRASTVAPATPASVGLVVESDVQPLIFEGLANRPKTAFIRGDGRIILCFVDPKRADMAATVSRIGLKLWRSEGMTIAVKLYDLDDKIVYESPIRVSPTSANILSPSFIAKVNDRESSVIHKVVLSTDDRGYWAVGSYRETSHPDMAFAGFEVSPVPPRTIKTGAPLWKTNSPIVAVSKQLYMQRPAAGASPYTGAYVRAYYVGPGLEREEIRSFGDGDNRSQPQRRRSADNGRTWKELGAADAESTIASHLRDISEFWGATTPPLYVREHNVLVSAWLRQTRVSKQPQRMFYNHSFIRISRDNGHTWNEGTLLRYEDGPDYDRTNPYNTEFLERNLGYTGQNLIQRGDGTLIVAAQKTKLPPGAPDPNPERIPFRDTEEAIAGRCFIGRWNPGAGDYEWLSGEPTWLPRHVSSDSVLEPSIAELKDGRLLIVWRGTNRHLNPRIAPGYRWFSISSDGGRTLSTPQPLRYDDGSTFYSPGSIHQTIRHSITQKLYWIGNISAHPCRTGDPRYPLVIAEVDEERIALKKDTVTVIDDRETGDGLFLQLSNFSLLENRETHSFEIYLSRAGMDPKARQFSKEFWSADAYKYTLRFN
jgi:hypothetical protein